MLAIEDVLVDFGLSPRERNLRFLPSSSSGFGLGISIPIKPSEGF